MDRGYGICVGPAGSGAAATLTLFYLAVSAALAVRIQRRFVSGGTMLAGAVTLAASAAASALGVQLGVVWTAIWESVRIGNDHFGSFRAAVPPWSAHPGALFAGGVVLFWIAAAIASRWPPDERNDRSLGGPDSPLLSGSDYPFGLKR